MTLALYPSLDQPILGTGGVGNEAMEQTSETSTGLRSQPTDLTAWITSLARGPFVLPRIQSEALAQIRELAAIYLKSGTGSATSVRVSVERGAVRPMLPARMSIAVIRSTLGLNMSETARALGVERATVYAWIAGRSEPQRLNWARLGRLERIAESWRRRSRLQMGELVRRPDSNGRSIADLLAQEPLRLSEIEERLNDVKERLGQSGLDGRRRVASIRSRTSALGLPAPTLTSAEGEITWLTRQSLGPEDE